MRKIYLSLSIGILFSGNGISQGCPTNLFFSEYMEGSSFNKTVEIYNPLPYTVDLNDYVVELYTNGSPTATGSFFMTGSLAPGQTYVICHPSSNAAILAIKDTVSGVINFNGDDAFVLKHEFTFDTLDIIGVVGVDPGTFWNVGAGTTQNYTLVRNSNIGIGTTDWSLSSTQWSVFALDFIDSLGTHYCNAPSNSYTFENYIICDNDSVYVQNTHYESLAGIYYDTLASVSGCDSIIITELFLNPTYLVQIDTSSCPGVPLFLGGANQTVAGLYYDNYSTTLGCDSIIEFNFTFFVEEFVQLNETICDGDSLFLEGGWQTLDGVYTDIYSSVVTGCDSIVETTLAVTIINTTVTTAGFDLTAVTSGATYQWLDCGMSFSEILGETNQTYSGTYNGNFAVEITQSGCVDTSLCNNISGIGFEENLTGNFLLYPNPAHSNLTVDFGKINSAIIEIIYVDGKLIQSIAVNEKQFVNLDLSELENGIYLLIVISENEKSVLRFVKE